MITTSQFPDTNGRTALPALGRSSKGPHMKMNKLSHPLARPAAPARPAPSARPAKPAAPVSSASTAIKSMKESTKLGQLASFASNTQLRTPR
jgi:hypothetical protein